MAAGDPKLLVIDDNPNDLEALRVLVEKAIPGCGLWTAHSGPEGLKLAGAVDPDVMLLDMFMPGMDGIEVIRNLKADEHLRAIPVVFLTSRRTSQEARLRAVHAGGDGLLPKRPNEQELIAEVRAMRKLKAANLGDQRKEGRQASRARGQTRRPRELPAAPMREEMRLRHREEERLRAQSARLKMLVDASRAFAAAGHDYLAVLDQLVRRVCRAFADSSQVRLLSADGQWLELAALHSRDPEATEALRALEGQPLERVDGSRTESRVFRSGKPALFPVITLEQLKASNPPERWPLYERFPPHSAMVVPMRVRGRCIGAMGVTRYRSELPSFTRDDLALAQDLADRAALAVSHARLVRQLPAELAERTCAEEELQRALALLNETQHITRAGGWEYDVRTRRVRWTEEVYRIHGVSGDYDPSSPTKDILFYAPDDQAAITAAFQRAVEKGESYDLELQLRTAQGDQIWVQTIGHAERSEGRIVRVYGTIVAITERKQAQLALRESEMRYRALVEQAGDAFFVHDFEGRFTEVNQRACDSLGYSRQELLQMGVLDVEQDFDLKSAQAEWARIQPGVPFTLHGHQRRKDGSVIPVEVRFGCFVWGGRRLFLGLARDITEREQARQALLESNQRFSLLFEKAAFAVSLSRLPDGVLVDVNEAFEKAFGFTRQEALGRTILELGIIPDAADRARIINELEKHGMVRDQEQLLRTKSAEQRTFSVNIHSVQIAGQQYLLNTALDIADRKRAEEALREERRRLNHVLATAPGAICSFRQHSDGSSDFPYANSSIQDIYGLEPQDLARDASIIRQLIHPDDLARVREAILESARTLSAWRQEYRFNHPRKGEVWLESHFMPEREPDGSTIWYGIITDITERKRTEQELHTVEGLFSSAFHAGPAGRTITRIADGKFIDANETFCRMFEFSRDEVIGHTSTELNMLSPEERAKLIRQQLESGGLQNFELLARSKSGRLINLLFSSTQLPLKGEPCHVTTMIDITERKRAEEALRQSEAWFRSVFESANVGKSITLTTGEINVNQAFADMLGYTPEELKQKKWQQITPAEEVEAVQRILEPLLSGQASSARFEKRYVHKNGSLIWADVSVVIRRDPAGKPLHFITTVIDITERKRAEEEITAQLQELRRWHDVMLDREDRVLELKKEVNDLMARDGQPPRYPSAAGESET